MAPFSPLGMGLVNPLFTEWPIPPVQNNVSSSSHHLPYLYEVKSIAQTRAGTPDLTASPTSSTSSISLAFDERWSIPLADLPPRSQSCGNLNPQAQPFVPFSSLMHNSILSQDRRDGQRISSVPVDYLKDTADGLPDYKLAPLSDWDTFSEEPLEWLENNAHLPSTPAYPPGLRIPHSCLHLPPPAVPPSYLPLIVDCLRFGTQNYTIESYSRVIVTSRPRWDLQSLRELSECICLEMYNPCTKPTDKDGHVITACDSARYNAVDPTRPISNGFLVEYERGAQRQQAIAIMVKYLDQHISIIQSPEAAQLFMWSLRESALTRFREIWDVENVNGRALNLSNPAASYDVRCALTLCKSIASFFNQKLIEPRHLKMCIRTLLRHLMSVEHVEALALLVLGCGPALWDVSTPTSTTYTNNQHEHAGYTAGQAFLTTLNTSVTNFSLHDSKSLVFPREVWGQGQLMTRLNQIGMAVNDWAVLVSRTPRTLQDCMGGARNMATF
ncbi:hypothetical protein BYT27DRAFT_7204963 [Phlegmacium glaucopus]|nr:hypothetical protein BYT27DRAFT_7204963 [Phlegmacium glaucopus]